MKQFKINFRFQDRNMLHCRIYAWKLLLGEKERADFRYIAKTKTQSLSISNTDIEFLTEMQKGKPPIKDLPN